MSSRPVRIPKYRRHKSGQAFVQVKGERFYIGKHGTEESIERYNRFVAELTASPTPESVAPNSWIVQGALVVELCAAYLRWALEYYGEDSGSMDRFQRLTGCRPGEVAVIRPADIDRTDNIWEYRPASHKGEWRGKERVIFIGPKAQAILAPYLLREADAYAFSPIDSERKRRAEQRARRKSKVQPSQVDRTKAKPKVTPRNRYDTNSYRRAIHRACDLAGIARWSLNSLRHSAGTEIRKRFGLEAAQMSLGHSKANVTQMYAERDAELAREVARKIG